MSQNSLVPTPGAEPNGRATRKKPVRFRIGVGLLVLYPLIYLIVPIAPFLPIDAAVKLGLVAGVVGAAEGVFLLGVACVGKEAYLAIKSKLGLGKKKPVKRAAAHPHTEIAKNTATVDVQRTAGRDTTAATTTPLQRNSEDEDV